MDNLMEGVLQLDPITSSCISWRNISFDQDPPSSSSSPLQTLTLGRRTFLARGRSTLSGLWGYQKSWSHQDLDPPSKHSSPVQSSTQIDTTRPCKPCFGRSYSSTNSSALDLERFKYRRMALIGTSPTATSPAVTSPAATGPAVTTAVSPFVRKGSGHYIRKSHKSHLPIPKERLRLHKEDDDDQENCPWGLDGGQDRNCQRSSSSSSVEGIREEGIYSKGQRPTTLPPPPTSGQGLGCGGSGGSSSSSGTGDKRSSKLKRRKAYYRDKKDQGRSRSLTHIDRLGAGMILTTGGSGVGGSDEMDSRSEPETANLDDHHLYVPSQVETPMSREIRRKKLARSQVSSSEFFGVSFDGPYGSGGLEEFLPASRGISLGEALAPLLERKHLTLSVLDIYVDSSKTPLPSPATTDTFCVAGKNIVIRPKEQQSLTHRSSKKETSASPSRQPSRRSKGRFFSASTEESFIAGSPTGSGSLEPNSPHPTTGVRSGCSISHEGSLKVKQNKQSTRWSGLFSNSSKDNSKMDLLAEQLNNFSKTGIPPLPILPSGEDDELEVDELSSLIGGWCGLSERLRQQQTAILELVETEVVYLRTIKVITDLFLACLTGLQAASILTEIDRDQLFSDIPQIYFANRTLWLSCILPMVKESRVTGRPLNPTLLRQGFLKFGSTCEPYVKYCLDQSKCQRYCRDQKGENELFKTYLAWCETQKECNRLKLMDILVRPMQRMTKYSLLLKAILKHTTDGEERRALDEMIQSVEKFVMSVNGALRSRQDSERLQSIVDRIESYDVVETREEELENLVKAHSRLDLFQPMPGCGDKTRWFLYEGDLRVKDANTKVDAHCFLFTDLLLICKATAKKGEKMKIIRPPFVVDRLRFREMSRDNGAIALIYLSEYGTVTSAFTFHTTETSSARTWMERIREAQKLFLQAKEKEVLEPRETVDEDVIDGHLLLGARTPRDGSSRASQLSSLVHSNSGSIEMNEASAISSRGLSFEHELRGSSLSSDDGGNGGHRDMTKHRSLSTEAPIPLSPRSERRSFLCKSPTPNTLSVQVPVRSLAGQSLPNLSSAVDALPPSSSTHSLLVPPKGVLSPTQRGISYPPPSPRIRRSQALQQSRNPPLQKAKNILSSSEGSYSMDAQSLPLKCLPTDEIGLGKSEWSPESHRKTLPAQISAPPIPYGVEVGTSNGNGPRRLARTERTDTKRYHTAGAIDDFRKENSKDTSIQKRLSWNYGVQPSSAVPIGGEPLRSRNFLSSESMTSFRSSSGVSSTASLLHSISDHEVRDEESVVGSPIPSSSHRTHPDVRIDVSGPDISELSIQAGEIQDKDEYKENPVQASSSTLPYVHFHG